MPSEPATAELLTKTVEPEKTPRSLAARAFTTIGLVSWTIVGILACVRSREELMTPAHDFLPFPVSADSLEKTMLAFGIIVSCLMPFAALDHRDVGFLGSFTVVCLCCAFIDSAGCKESNDPNKWMYILSGF